MTDEAVDRFFRVAIPIIDTPAARAIFERIKPGQIGCLSCGYVGDKAEFPLILNRYTKRLNPQCPRCESILGPKPWIDADQVGIQSKKAKVA